MAQPTNSEILRAIADLRQHFDAEIAKVRAELKEQGLDIRGDLKAVNARLDEQRAWLQSTDQRFTAIMAPYQQKPAA